MYDNCSHAHTKTKKQKPSQMHYFPLKSHGNCVYTNSFDSRTRFASILECRDDCSFLILFSLPQCVLVYVCMLRLLNSCALSNFHTKYTEWCSYKPIERPFSKLKKRKRKDKQFNQNDFPRINEIIE